MFASLPHPTAWLALALSGCTLTTGGTQVDPVPDAGGTTGLTGISSGLPTDSGPETSDALVAPDAEAGPPGCPLAGMHALKLSARVGWDAKELGLGFNAIEMGSGQLDMLVLVDLDRTDNVLEGQLQVCDAQVPTFESDPSGLGGETYAVKFDEAMWESDRMPRVPARLELACPDVGCSVSVPTVTVLLGVAMPDPTARWPEDRNLLTYPDHDGDGFGGVTVDALGPSAGGSHQYPPTRIDLFFPGRANQLMLGIRVAAALEGTLESCERITGNSSSLSIETHATTCTLADTGARCTGEQAQFVDDNLPQWVVESATFSSALLDDTADCEAARAAL